MNKQAKLPFVLRLFLLANASAVLVWLLIASLKLALSLVFARLRLEPTIESVAATLFAVPLVSLGLLGLVVSLTEFLADVAARCEPHACVVSHSLAHSLTYSLTHLLFL